MPLAYTLLQSSLTLQSPHPQLAAQLTKTPTRRTADPFLPIGPDENLSRARFSMSKVCLRVLRDLPRNLKSSTLLTDGALAKWEASLQQEFRSRRSSGAEESGRSSEDFVLARRAVPGSAKRPALPVSKASRLTLFGQQTVPVCPHRHFLQKITKDTKTSLGYRRPRPGQILVRPNGRSQRYLFVNFVTFCADVSLVFPTGTV